MKRPLVTFVLIIALSLAALSARAQRVDQLPPASTGGFDDRIVAVVNDSVISSADVEERMALALLSANLPNTAEIRQKLLPQVLRGLIDEHLQLQEAKRLDISISDDEINKALDRIAQENHIPGDMKTYLTDHGVSPDSLVTQIRAALAWGKVVQRELRPNVEVGDDEVDAVIQRMRANAGKQEYLVSEIFLSVDNPKDEDQVKQFAENLVVQLKNGGNFGSIAREFSQGTGAAAGGDIGWIQEGQLSPELNRALLAMGPGEIAGPIRSADGYHILGVREKRTIAGSDPKDISINLQQVFRPFGTVFDKDKLLKEAGQLRSSIGSCGDLKTKLPAQFPDWHWQDLGDVKLANAPKWLADSVRDLPEGKSSEPMATDKGALILFVCGRKVPEGDIDREAITNQIGTEKLELQARRLLRDLRRQAYLDVRLASGS